MVIKWKKYKLYDHMDQNKKQLLRRKDMNTERKILLKLTEFLEKNHLISPSEKNRADSIIERGNF